MTVLLSKLPDVPELPPEVWTEIFSHLSSYHLLKVRLVCHLWKDIVNTSPLLLDKLPVTFPEGLTIGSNYKPGNLPYATKAHFKEVIVNAIGSWWPSFGKGLTEIKLDNGSEIGWAEFLKMLKHVPNLKCLELIDLRLVDDQLMATELHLGALEKLKLDGISAAEDLVVFRKLCCNLKSLKITWDCLELDLHQQLEGFLDDSRNTLEELHINCTMDILDELMKRDRLKLKKLTLAGGDLENNMRLIELIRMHPSLEYIDINEILSFDETNQTMLSELGQLLPKLKYLSIRATDVELLFLKNFPKVQIFNLFGKGKSTWTIKFNGSEHIKLRELNLQNIHFLDNSLQPYLATLQHLRSINLTWCTFVTWSDLLNALESLRSLQNLVLHGIHVKECTNFSVNDLTRLKYLQLAHCELSQEMLATVLSRCPGLRELYLTFMDTSADVVQVICKELMQLEKLVIDECSLSSEDERCIRENFHHLELLRISDSW